MNSRFPYQNPVEAAEFAFAYFERLRADPDIRKTWLGLGALIQVRIAQPDVAVYVDTRDGETMVVTPGIASEPPGRITIALPPGSRLLDKVRLCAILHSSCTLVFS